MHVVTNLSLELCPANVVAKDFGGTGTVVVETVSDKTCGEGWVCVGIVTVAGTASSACQSNMARQVELQTNW